MSGGAACRNPTEHRERWFVPTGRRNVEVSAFNGYRPRFSLYSDVWCPLCPRVWRTKAKYVSTLPDSDLEFQLAQAGKTKAS